MTLIPTDYDSEMLREVTAWPLDQLRAKIAAGEFPPADYHMAGVSYWHVSTVLRGTGLQSIEELEESGRYIASRIHRSGAHHEFR